MTGQEYFFAKAKSVLNIFYLLAIIAGIGFLLYAGFKYMISGGGKSSEIHKEILFIIIGLIFVIFALTIPILLYSFLK